MTSTTTVAPPNTRPCTRCFVGLATDISGLCPTCLPARRRRRRRPPPTSRTLPAGRPYEHPDQAEPVQSATDRQPCHQCSLPTYNVVDGRPRCLFHHEGDRR